MQEEDAPQSKNDLELLIQARRNGANLHLSALHIIELLPFHFGPEDIPQLAQYLMANSDLETLDLSAHSIGDEDTAAKEMQRADAHFKQLDLDIYNPSDATELAITEMLQNLCLHDIYAENHVSNARAAALAEMLKINTALRHLNLAYMKMGPIGVVRISDALKTNSALHSLILQENFLGHVGAIAMADMLKTNTTLKVLNLKHAFYSAEGVLCILRALKTNASLQKLDLRECLYWGLHAVGMVAAIAEMLQTNRTLQCLYIDTPNGHDITCIAEALETNNCLQKLRLHCPLTLPGLFAIAEMLKTNTTLRCLHLGNGYAPDQAGIRAIAKALEENRTLQTLSLCSNPSSCTYDPWKRITELLLRNQQLQREYEKESPAILSAATKLPPPVVTLIGGYLGFLPPPALVVPAENAAPVVLQEAPRISPLRSVVS